MKQEINWKSGETIGKMKPRTGLKGSDAASKACADDIKLVLMNTGHGTAPDEILQRLQTRYRADSLLRAEEADEAYRSPDDRIVSRRNLRTTFAERQTDAREGTEAYPHRPGCPEQQSIRQDETRF